MAIFLAIPIIGLMVVFQSAVFSQVQLLYGTADLVLLIVVAWAVQDRVTTAWHWGIIAGVLASLATAVPAFAVIPTYVVVTGIAIYMRRVFCDDYGDCAGNLDCPDNHSCCAGDQWHINTGI
jgi:hypothetical protein